MIRKSFTGIVAALALLAPMALTAPAQASPQPAVPIVSGEVDPGAPPAEVVGSKPKGVKALKGNPGHATDSAAASRALLAGPPYYYYGLSRQTLATGEKAEGFAANLNIETPFLDPGQLVNGVHSLGEIAVSDRAGANYVEAGTTHDPGLCGATPVPCLFVFWWKNGVPQCYNGCGWVENTTNCSVAGALCAGDSLSSLVGTAKRFQIQRTSVAWWISFNGVWIGAFPDSLWTGSTPSGPAVTNFKYGEMFSAFYEVVSDDLNPCTDMGNGYLGTDASGLAARTGSMALVTKTPTTIVDNLPSSITTDFGVAAPATVYSNSQLSTTTSRTGGPGWNAAGTAAGTRGAC